MEAHIEQSTQPSKKPVTGLIETLEGVSIECIASNFSDRMPFVWIVCANGDLVDAFDSLSDARAVAHYERYIRRVQS